MKRYPYQCSGMDPEIEEEWGGDTVEIGGSVYNLQYCIGTGDT